LLSPADSDIVARDPAIHDLGLLLDEDAFGAALQKRLPDANVNQVKARYIRYRPGKDCLVRYQAKISGDSIDLHAKAYRDRPNGRQSNGEHANGSATGVSAANGTPANGITAIGPLNRGLGGTMFAKHFACGRATEVFIFPRDHDIPILDEFADDDRRESLLHTIVPSRPRLWSSKPVKASYKPERRYAAQLFHGLEKVAHVKIYSEPAFKLSNQYVKYFDSRGHLRVAKRFGRSDKHRIVVMESLPGKNLSELIAAPGFDAAIMNPVGSALAMLQQQTPRRLRRSGLREYPKIVDASVRAVSFLYPDQAARMERLAGELMTQLDGSYSPTGLIHGEFSAEHVLVSEKHVAIVDLDAAAIGFLVDDLGSFAADLELQALSGRISTNHGDQILEHLLAGYDNGSRNQNHPAFMTATALALINLAPAPFLNRQQNWRWLVRGILDRVEHYLFDTI
jgi:tRNA A-37 threonylcarbamoyl transferase component Bud32